MIVAFLLLALLVGGWDKAHATLCTLEWDAPEDRTNLAGYYAYQSTPGVPYPLTPSWVGNTTFVSCDLLGVKADGKTYTFVVKAYQADMQVSGPSNEVSKTMPLIVPNNGLRVMSDAPEMVVIEGMGTCKSIDTSTIGSTKLTPRRTLKCK